MCYMNSLTCLYVIILTSASKEGKAGTLQLPDRNYACFSGIRPASTKELYVSGHFKELPGEAESGTLFFCLSVFQ